MYKVIKFITPLVSRIKVYKMLRGVLVILNKKICIETYIKDMDLLFEIINYEMLLLSSKLKHALIEEKPLVLERIKWLSDIYFSKKDNWVWEDNIVVYQAMPLRIDKPVEKVDKRKMTHIRIQLNSNGVFYKKYDVDKLTEVKRDIVREISAIEETHKTSVSVE